MRSERNEVTREIRMMSERNEVTREIRSPKEKLDEVNKMYNSVWEFVNKFLEKKFKREFKFNGVQHDLNLKGASKGDYKIYHIYFSLKGKFASQLIVDWNSITIAVNGTNVYDSLLITTNKNRNHKKYQHLIEYFENSGNRTKIIDYANYINKFLWTTPYIFVLPKAYTFLLCNRTTKIFPRDIAKLITHKILFFFLKKFLPQKKIKKLKKKKLNKKNKKIKI
jgi:hypothetical protein